MKRWMVRAKYSEDNDGEAVEEQSGIFERVESIQTSYH